MPVRDSFWNIPYWVECPQFNFLDSAIGVFSYRVLRHIRHLWKGPTGSRTGEVKGWRKNNGLKLG
jgi:hypothetical protein